MNTQHTSTDLRIVMAQLNFVVGDIHSNAEKIVTASKHARDELSADAIVFPELALTGYPPEDLLLRAHFIEQVETAVERICREVKGITVITGYPLKQAGDLYNAAGVM
jgi:NAD+ synthase (glutamine-hydrolysing)